MPKHRRKRNSHARVIRKRLSPDRRYLESRKMRSRFLATIAGRPGDLLSLSRMREGSRMSKSAFDKAILGLEKDGRVSLHHHDYPHSLSSGDRDKLVHDSKNNTYYVGVALKQ